MKEKSNFFLELKTVLEEVLQWEQNYRGGLKNNNFDIDNKLYFIFEKYEVDVHLKPLILVYNLLDYYCDAVRHGFKEINNNYSMQDAKQDVKLISETLSEIQDLNLLLNKDMDEKLSGIFQ